MNNRVFAMLTPLLLSFAAISPRDGSVSADRSSPSAVSAGMDVGAAMLSCGHCSEWSQLFLWQHAFGGGGCVGGGGEGCYDCQIFNSCHSNSQQGTCSGYHTGCGGGYLSRAQPLDKGLFHLVDQVASSNDQLLIRTIVARFRGIVDLNEERQALQVRNCSGTIIASYPLGLDRFASLSVGE